MRVTKLRVDSGSAGMKTTRNRTRELGEHRHLTSQGSEICQLQDEVKACSPDERQQILANFQTVVVSTSQAVAMKADLGIPWSKLRVIRRYMHI